MGETTPAAPDPTRRTDGQRTLAKKTAPKPAAKKPAPKAARPAASAPTKPAASKTKAAEKPKASDKKGTPVAKAAAEKPAKKTEAKKSDTKKPAVKPEPKKPAAKSEPKKADTKKPAAKPEPKKPASKSDPKKTEAAKPDAKKTVEVKKSDPKKTDAKKPDPKKSEAAKPEAKKPAKADPKKPDAKADAKAETPAPAKAADKKPGKKPAIDPDAIELEVEDPVEIDDAVLDTSKDKKGPRKGITVVEGGKKPPSKSKAVSKYNPPIRPMLLGPGSKLSKPLIPSGPSAPKITSLADAPKSKRTKSPLTKAKLDKYRLLLLAKRAELFGDVVSMENEALRSESSDLSNTPQHIAEQGSENYDQTLSLNLAAQDRRLIKEIDEALKRIEEGTYGLCELTNLPIPEDRLDVLPWARYTIEAARELENRGPLS